MKLLLKLQHQIYRLQQEYPGAYLYQRELEGFIEMRYKHAPANFWELNK